MLVHGIEFKEKKCPYPFLDKVTWRGVYPSSRLEKNGYGIFQPSAYIDTNDFRDYSNGGDFTVCAWARRSSPAADYVACQTRVHSPYGSDWIIVGGGALFWMRSRSIGSANVLNDFKWHHLAFAWDQGRERYRGYYDGIFIGESLVVSGYGGIGSVKIGTRGDALISFWNGGIAHFKIFLRKLTDTQIKSIFEMTRITDSLGSYYPLIDDARDYSGRGKHGINHGVEFTRGW